jgi:putative transposase
MPWKATRPMDLRMEFVATARGGHLTMAAACRRFGVSRRTGYKWLGRFEESGSQGLGDRSRAPKTHPHAVSTETAELLLEARRAHRHWGARTILDFVARRGIKGLPAASTVSELFKRHGLIKSGTPRSRQLHGEAPEPDFSGPNRTWCADFKGQFQLGDRSWCFPLTISDGFSRYLLCCKGLPDTKGNPVQRAFEHCFRENGLPDAILTDNGKPFASHAVGGLSRLSVWWTKLGIRLHRIVPGRPQQNGRHERMHRTLKQETADSPAASLRGEQPLLDKFRQEYNCDRPHRALGGRSPIHVYCRSTRQLPSRIEPPSYPGHQAVRSVRTDGSICFRGDSFFLSEALVGEQVGLQEFDDDRFLLRFGPLELATLDCRSAEPVLNRLPGPL